MLVPASAVFATATKFGYTHTAATRGAPGAGALALLHNERIRPGESRPSSVVRSMQRIAKSIAPRFAKPLNERVAKLAARASSITASTEHAVDCIESVSSRPTRRGTWAPTFSLSRPTSRQVARRVPRREAAGRCRGKCGTIHRRRRRNSHSRRNGDRNLRVCAAAGACAVTTNALLLDGAVLRTPHRRRGSQHRSRAPICRLARQP